MIKPDVSFDEIKEKFVINSYTNARGIFTVSVFKKAEAVGNYVVTDRLHIGEIEGYAGQWKVINDPKFETSQLIKAIKRAIDNYLRFENEFDMVKKELDK